MGDIRFFLYNVSPFFFWLKICLIVFLFSLQNPFSFISLLLMLSLHHGCHEAIHGTLIPKNWRYCKQLNYLSGCIGCAFIGHNFLTARWSHSFHHVVGRLSSEVTIDLTSINRGFLGHLNYYLQLLGWNALKHEVGGYSLFLKDSSNNSEYPDNSFIPPHEKRSSWIICQALVLLVTGFLIFTGGWYFVLCRVLFLPMWGIGQNIAHYSLPAGEEPFLEFAARTYRVNLITNFLLYGAGFYHFEHHVLPSVPGLLLWHESVQRKISTSLGFYPEPENGFFRYFRDAMRQFLGPFPQVSGAWPSRDILVPSTSSEK